MIRQARRKHRNAAADIDARRIAFRIRRGIIRKARLFIDAHALAHRHVRRRGHVILDGADDADRMIVIGHHQDQRVVAARLRPVAHQPHHIVEHDGVVDRALHVEQVGVFVDQAGFDHQEEAVRILRQDFRARLAVMSVRSG